MANNLRYLLEHFCLDGQKIDIASQLDEENADKIEKLNNETVPSINARIDEIKDTDIPNINSRIDGIKNTDIPNINQKINSINNVSIPTLDRRITGVDDKADSINIKVEKNSKDIATLSDNVTAQGNDINSTNTEKIPNIEKDIKTAQGKISTLEEIVAPLPQKVDDNATNIEGLTNSINDLTNNAIPPIKNNVTNLQTKTADLESDLTELRSVTVDEISKKVEDLTTKAGTNTNDISTLTEKVETNTTDISTINDTSIPHLQSEIDTIKTSMGFEWRQILNTTTPHGIKLKGWRNETLKLMQINISYQAPHDIITDEIKDTIEGLNAIAPRYRMSTISSPDIDGSLATNGYVTVYQDSESLLFGVSVTIMSNMNAGEITTGTVLYSYI